MPGVIRANIPGPQVAADFNPYDTSVWRWDVGRTESPGEGVITTGDATVTMVGYLIDPSLLLATQAYFLGYSYVDGTTLKRSVPAFCPESPWLLCTQFSYKGIKYTGDQGYPWDGFPGALPLPGYTYYHCTVTFTAVDYLALPDDDLAGRPESARFLSIVPDDETELIAVDGGQYVYRSTRVQDKFATALGAATPKGINYIVKGASLRVHANRTGLLVTWKDVAEDYVADEFTRMVAFEKSKGRINQTTFLNRPPGTMLLETFRVTKRPAVLATTIFDQQKFLLTIEMRFKFTDPDRGDPAEPVQGWNLAPGPRGNSAKGWFYAWNFNTDETGHNDDSVGIYDDYEMNNIFKHWSFA